MSDQLKPSKRPYYRHETNGKGKRQKTAAFTSQNLRISPGITFFCLLCPDFKGGSVIGKGGGNNIPNTSRTGAKVRVEETIPGCDERIIIIVGSDKENEVGAEQSKDDDETNSIDEVDNAEEQDDDGKDNQSFPMEDSQSVKGPSSVQKALLLVFERIAERDSGMDEADEESDKTSKFSLRLLVPSTQVDCLLGNGGGVIKQMSSESGAQISILPRDKLPVCASSSDELFQFQLAIVFHNFLVAWIQLGKLFYLSLNSFWRIRLGRMTLPLRTLVVHHLKPLVILFPGQRLTHHQTILSLLKDHNMLLGLVMVIVLRIS